MPEDNRALTTQARTPETEEEAASPATEAPDSLAGATEEPQSDTGRMPRDAINKVMDQINYHQREAKKHLQRVEELRKDLRESFAFLQDQKSKEKTTGSDKKNTPPAAKEKTEEPAEMARQPRGKAKKKRA